MSPQHQETGNQGVIMPHQVAYDVTADKLRKGDVSGALTIADVDVKTKYVFVTFEDDDKPVRVERSQPYKVFRTEETEEEKDAKVRATGVSMVQHRLDEKDAKVEAKKAKLVTALEYRPDCHWREYEEYVYAQSEFAQWLQVERTLDWLRNSGSEDANPDADLLDALQVVVDETMDAFLNEARFMNTSTAVMSNAVEAAKSEATQKWLRTYKSWTRAARLHSATR